MGLWARFLDWLRSLFWSRELKVVIIGLQNAGKTTLVNCLATGEFDEDTIPTIGFNYREVKKGGVQLNMWDLGGQPKFRESWEKYSRGSDCILFVVDSADHGNLEIAASQLHRLLSWPSLNQIPLLVLGNKNDLEGALIEEELVSVLGLQQIRGRSVACYSISAKNATNIDVTLKYLAKLQRPSN